VTDCTGPSTVRPVKLEPFLCFIQCEGVCEGPNISKFSLSLLSLPRKQLPPPRTPSCRIRGAAASDVQFGLTLQAGRRLLRWRAQGYNEGKRGVEQQLRQRVRLEPPRRRRYAVLGSNQLQFVPGVHACERT
jgi:hypothetical protein